MKLSVAFALVGVITTCLFYRKIYFDADPFMLSGWLWFVGLLVSLGLFAYGIYGCLTYVQNIPGI